MKIDELPEELLEQIKQVQYDRIVEKHEGPFTWNWMLKPLSDSASSILYQLNPNYDPIAQKPDFLSIAGQWALLPIGRGQHPNITILHHFLSEDQSKMVIYLKNTTYDDSPFGAGYVAICERFAEESFYIATLYHEWFIIDYDANAI